MRVPWPWADAAVSTSMAGILLIGTGLLAGLALYSTLLSADDFTHVPARAFVAHWSARDDDVVTYMVSHATPGLEWNEMQVAVDGIVVTMSDAPGCPTPSYGEFVACRAGGTLSQDHNVQAGDLIAFRAGLGSRLLIVDSLTLTPLQTTDSVP